MLTSKLCAKSDFETEWFQRWRPIMAHYAGNNIRLGGAFLHRKEWELVFICQALDERGLLERGKKGIGFAVGREPLPAIFASRGCDILATDNSSDSNGAWSDQWASGKSDLSQPEICDPSVLESHVEFRQIDMNHIPMLVNEFDFSWSCCALEHLGSLQSGFSFLFSQLQCLKPGGVAVHTMEFNLSSNWRTIETGQTVLYRRKDVERFVKFVDSQGHVVEAVDFTEGRDPADRFIARQPWDDLKKNVAHLRLKIGGFVCTSLALIIRKGL
ncbi:MAG TPA: class I SAM-dependent methyltransferase [Candidatus Acidoferrum sp.]|nr:class I SAM-dependent methyltransferase [Candidatus Acidoferrum sp.]